MNRTSLEVLQKLGGWKALAMVQRYAHLADQFTAQYAGNAKPVAFGQLTQNWHKAKAAADDKTGKNPLVNVLTHSLLVIPDTSFTVFGIDRENCYAMEGVSQDG